MGLAGGQAWSPHPRQRRSHGTGGVDAAGDGQRGRRFGRLGGRNRSLSAPGRRFHIPGYVAQLGGHLAGPFDSLIAHNSLSLVLNPAGAAGHLDALSAMGRPPRSWWERSEIPTALTTRSISPTSKPIGPQVEWGARSAGVIDSTAWPHLGTRSCRPAERNWPRWPSDWDGD